MWRIVLKWLFWFRHGHGVNKLKKNGLKLGDDTKIFNKARDYGCNPELITIGNNCVVASGVLLISSQSLLKFIPGKEKTTGHGIVVHDNCFLGINSIIYPGVSIGPHAVVGAGTVVTADVPPNMCVSGNPMHVNCTVDLYRCICRKGVIPNYSPMNKRYHLQAYFWK